MLSYLAIHQIALIESASLEPAAGLNVLSGESGAGKSVVLDALAFVAGAARPRCQVRAGAPGGHVEALFQIGPEEKLNLSDLFGSLHLPLEDEIVLSRRIDAHGRSRCFVQGLLVPLRTLCEVSSQLIEFSDQGDSHALKSATAQLRLLDTCAGLNDEAAQMNASYERLRLLTAARDEQRKQADEAERRLDFLEFQLRELDACRTSEFSAACARLEALEETRAIHDFSRGLAQEIAGGDRNLLDRLVAWERRLRGVALPVDSELAHRLALTLENLSGLAQLASAIQDAHEVSCEELADVEDVVQRVRDLSRKHRVEPEALENRAEALRAELRRIEDAAIERRELELRCEQERLRAEELAAHLHQKRSAAAFELGARARGELEALGLPGAQLSLEVKRGPLGPLGITHLDIGFAGHAGAEPRPLGRVASGGELGRVLLALRLATKARRPLLVLDEIDAGSGGHAAARIGSSLGRAAQLGQILCVSHWPQVACHAQRHWVVTKSVVDTNDTGKVARSELSTVQDDSRLNELCRMLGGSAHTGRAHAAALLQAARDEAAASPRAKTKQAGARGAQKKTSSRPANQGAGTEASKRRKLRLVPSAA